MHLLFYGPQEIFLPSAWPFLKKRCQAKTRPHSLGVRTTLGGERMAQITNFFAGANSGEGFQNLFPELVDLGDTYDLMMLKRGPRGG